MHFGPIQEALFGTSEGAYSTVTHREVYDSQITLTDSEADIAISHFGKANIHVGNVGSNRTKARKTFLLHPTGEPIYLNLVFPKPHKPELRLYLSSRAGYKPAADEIWFLYVKGSQIFLGAMDEEEWEEADKGARETKERREVLRRVIEEDDNTPVDPEDEGYQALINDGDDFIKMVERSGGGGTSP